MKREIRVEEMELSDLDLKCKKPRENWKDEVKKH